MENTIPNLNIGNIDFKASTEKLLGSLEERTRSAMERVRDHLFSLQQPDGHWVAELKADTTLPSDYILMMHFLGIQHPDKVKKLCNHIRSQQLEDGSWNIYPGGRGEISATVKAYTAFKLAGFTQHEPFMKKAREAIFRLGGVEPCNSFTKIYLALIGQYEWGATPAIPTELILSPRWFYFNIYEISSWSRAIVIPLCIIYAFRPARPVSKGYGIDELFEGIPRPKKIHFDSRKIMSWKNLFLLFDRILKWLEKSPIKPFRKMALRRAERWMLERLEMSDGLGAIYPAMVNSIFALHCLGYENDHPIVSRALKQLQEFEVMEGDTIRLQPCFSPIWDTALAMVSLTEAGISSDHPSIKKAVRWLIEKQVRHRGDWCFKLPNIKPGGWYFEYSNEFYPDVDDTLMVLIALKRVHSGTSPRRSVGENNFRSTRPWSLTTDEWQREAQSLDKKLSSGSREEVLGLESAIERGLQWVRAMQNRDGGWASFDKDNTRMIFTKVPFADHNAMLDPSSADITGRVLEMLGQFGFDRCDAQVKLAIDYLKKEQEGDGSWYGRWGVNYIYGTWQVLKGLFMAGVDMSQEYCQRAAEWLRSCQNADGGWGESCRSYDDILEKANGPSTPSQTAWALMGLFASGDTQSKTVLLGLDYLVSTQKKDGSWDEWPYTGTGFPRVFYIKYEYYKIYFPLFALGYYFKAKNDK